MEILQYCTKPSILYTMRNPSRSSHNLWCMKTWHPVLTFKFCIDFYSLPFLSRNSFYYLWSFGCGAPDRISHFLTLTRYPCTLKRIKLMLTSKVSKITENVSILRLCHLKKYNTKFEIWKVDIHVYVFLPQKTTQSIYIYINGLMIFETMAVFWRNWRKKINSSASVPFFDTLNFE